MYCECHRLCCFAGLPRHVVRRRRQGERGTDCHYDRVAVDVGGHAAAVVYCGQQGTCAPPPLAQPALLPVYQSIAFIYFSY